MTISIIPTRPDCLDAAALIAELEAYLAPLYPPSSQHGLSIDQLLRENVAFFILRVDGQAAGCGGFKNEAGEYAEIKRLYVRPQYQGKGYGRLLLEYIERAALQRGICCLRLETGIFQPAAIRLYEKCGFQRRAPFGAYTDDLLSVYFEKKLVN
jgi:putative acetyltransferase